jgi:hypothetical protein
MARASQVTVAVLVSYSICLRLSLSIYEVTLRVKGLPHGKQLTDPYAPLFVCHLRRGADCSCPARRLSRATVEEILTPKVPALHSTTTYEQASPRRSATVLTPRGTGCQHADPVRFQLLPLRQVARCASTRRRATPHSRTPRSRPCTEDRTLLGTVSREHLEQLVRRQHDFFCRRLHPSDLDVVVRFMARSGRGRRRMVAWRGVRHA